MATYAELLNIATTSDALKQQIKVARIVACDVIRAEAEATPNHANRLAWARATLSNPDSAASQMVMAVLAQNRAAIARPRRAAARSPSSYCSSPLRKVVTTPAMSSR